MAATNHTSIQVGDWISGTSQLDEKFIGYVDSLAEDNMVKVWVTQSDHDNIVGEYVQTKLPKLRKLAEDNPFNQDELVSLIDLALMTKDKDWFQDLVSQSYMSAKQLSGRWKDNGSSKKQTYNMKWSSRLNERNL
ncbi:IDEAL domain-containing protein [Paenibacillus solisilvae]|uniref:IDEAL domain-containing protein n=1 Tax=Paenibacillus solisilvae TaxID=2486751 RepID=A0ABW0VZM1_9BACL